MSDNYELDQLIAAAIDSAVANLHVALPGKVTAYDAATRTCTVQPTVRKPVLDENDALSFEEFPPIPNVPVVFPGAASLTVYFALAPGDVVALVWQDYSPAQWRKTGAVSDAGDVHAHGPSYPVAFPWYRPNGGPGSEPDESIGKPGGLRLHFKAGAIEVGRGGDFVALKSAVDAIQQALDTHVHPTGVGPSGPVASPIGPQASSSNLKADS